MSDTLELMTCDTKTPFTVVYIGGGKWGVNMNGQAAGRIVQGITQAWVARVAKTADGEAGDDVSVPIDGYPEHADMMRAAYAVARAYFDRHMQPATV